MDGMAPTGDNSPDQRDPVIDQWLSDVPGGPGFLLKTHQLTGLEFTIWRDEPPEVPDEVMTRWHWLIAVQHRIANQSESAFIEQACRQGWTWQRIADVFGLPNAEAAEQRRAVVAELTHTLPSNLLQPWLG
jgi:hypothetical protein